MDESPKSATKFVILTSQRSGSTLLIRSLDSSPVVLCAGEIFHSGEGIHRLEFQYPRKCLGSTALGGLRDALMARSRIRRHLNRFYTPADHRIQAVGFKLMLSQVRQLPPILPVLAEVGARLIFLYRDDSIATALSYCRAKTSRVFHSDKPGATREQAAVHIREDVFARILKKCRNDKEELIQLSAVHAGSLMRYEDMVTDWDVCVKRLGVELGISGLRIQKALQKLTPEVNSARILNEDELLAKFRDAR